MVAPVLDELAEEMDGKVRVAKLNVDANQQLAIQYRVSSIPTFILFKNGADRRPHDGRHAEVRVQELHPPQLLAER